MNVDAVLLRESWGLVSGKSEKVAAEFYGMLFSRHAQVRAMFPAGMEAQRDRILGALTYVILNLENLDDVVVYLGELARDHRKYGVRPEHYPIIGRCLVASMRANGGDSWRPAYDHAWLAAYELIADTMIKAAADDEKFSPPYWNARVIAHEQRSPEVAVITVEPDQIYPFQAGQHATIQTARWPRTWRHYSIANAPRPDNLLTFHVRIVPGGWVSTALAHHTSVGDQVLLGPPRGNMVLPSPRPERLLCIAGGTGLAPIKALIEETLRATHMADVTLIHGVRQRRDLYDSNDLARLFASPGRVRLIIALSDDPVHRPRLTVAEAVTGDDVEGLPATFVCGPPEMMPATLDRLAELGLPSSRVQCEPDTGRGELRVSASS